MGHTNTKVDGCDDRRWPLPNEFYDFDSIIYCPGCRYKRVIDAVPLARTQSPRHVAKQEDIQIWRKIKNAFSI